MLKTCALSVPLPARHREGLPAEPARKRAGVVPSRGGRGARVLWLAAAGGGKAPPLELSELTAIGPLDGCDARSPLPPTHPSRRRRWRRRLRCARAECASAARAVATRPRWRRCATCSASTRS